MAVRRVVGPLAAKLEIALKELHGLEGRTGWFETAHYPDGTPVAYIAAVQEMGSGPIPARPFMRPTVAEKGAEWMGLFGQGAKACLTGGATPYQVMEKVALKAASDVGQKISQITSPPLSILTLMARARGKQNGISGKKQLGELAGELNKGPPNLAGVSTKPLVWTGLMRQTVTGVVTKGGNVPVKA